MGWTQDIRELFALRSSFYLHIQVGKPTILHYPGTKSPSLRRARWDNVPYIQTAQLYLKTHQREI